MTTKQIIDQMEKEFDEKFWHEEALETHQPCEYLLNNEDGKCNCQIKDIKKFIHSYTRTLLESFGEEIIGGSGKNYIEWRFYVEKEYAKGRKDKKPKLILGYPEWLEEKQRLKVKEILEVIK